MFLLIMSAIGAALSVYLGYLLLRYSHLRRLAWRSIRNQRRSTLLTIIGLAISTALISMTLIANATLTRTAESETENYYGPIAYDIPSRNQPAAASTFFDFQTIQQIRQKIDGPSLPIVNLPATYMTKNGKGEIKRHSPYINTIGVDTAEAIRFDSSLSKLLSSEPQRDEVLLSSRAAAVLKARTGDAVYVVDASNREHRLRVSGVLQERGLTGYPGIFRAHATAIVALDTARSLAGIDGPTYTNLLTTNRPPSEWIGEPVLENYTSTSKDAIGFLTILIGIASLNAILIGIVLVTNIFRLIAEERRNEMGILRAIGLGKSDIWRLLMLEGLLYGIFSGMIGVAIGWMLAYILLKQIAPMIIGESFLNLMSHLTVDPVLALSSLSFGLLIIFLCVLFIARKTVKLSIVEAIQPVQPMRQTNKKQAIRNSWLFILSCLIMMSFTILFAVPDIRKEWITDDQIPVIIAILFLSIPLLAFITARLLPLIGRGILYMFRNTAAASLIIRLAFRNLNTNPLRTGLILFMFIAISCFISFFILYSNTMRQYMSEDNPIVLTGGHDLAARDWRPLDTESIVRHMEASDEYERIAPFQLSAVQQLLWKKSWGEWGQYEIKINGIDSSFAESNDIPLLVRDSKYASDREAWREIIHNDEVVIVATDVRSYGVGELIPIQVGDRTVNKTVIAIAGLSGYDPESYGIWTNPNVLEELAKSKSEIHSTVFIKLGEQADNESIERIKHLLSLQNIYPVTNIVESEIGYYRQGIFISNMLQTFNIAALGIGMIGLIVVMYRLIRQRSRQIGVLRAIGMRPDTVLLSLMLEGFILGSLGLALGFAVGASVSFVSFNTISELSEADSLSLPFLKLLIYFCAALALSLAFSFVPARKALQVSPTEATRISN
ncbi:FtsX-like permease family protein [Paenibacillus sp. LHD-117]|uniref:ABC transporter permease n=1 Tax=Paenibacillus sp. LHD-117 TaxID=3071412 RepID=UPI0027E11E10|nr:FtsX-like permease family protein [Paenibacillus sp. LHD-117]MDQ6423649.1 FtsX-like permease family protein [Paenibacillus sp. LHD-117]